MKGGGDVDNCGLHFLPSEHNYPIYSDSSDIGAVSGSGAVPVGMSPKLVVGTGGGWGNGKVQWRQRRRRRRKLQRHRRWGRTEIITITTTKEEGNNIT